MKFISQVDKIEILREIHEGEYGHHAAARSLVAKAFRHGSTGLQPRQMQTESWSSAKVARCIPSKPTCPPQNCI
jgi:hypothetical protein